MHVAVESAGLTDRGRVRALNEDQFLIAELDKLMVVHQTSLANGDSARLVGRTRGHLFVVADGMGGMGGGKRASEVAVEALTVAFEHLKIGEAPMSPHYGLGPLQVRVSGQNGVTIALRYIEDRGLQVADERIYLIHLAPQP